MSASRAGCTFSAFGHDKKADQKSPLERLFKARNLCYSVDEANRMPNGHFTRPASAGANGRNVPTNESFNIWWRYITKKELSAHMYRSREVCFVSILCICFLNDYGWGNQFREVVHDQPGKVLLVYVLHFFAWKWSSPIVYFSSRKEVSSPQRIL